MNPTGPRTESGKQRTKYNAIKHGLTGQTLFIRDHERPHYEAHCQSYVDLYRPAGRPEEVLVRAIADDYWRALSGRALESCHMIRATRNGSDDKVLCNLSLYLQRIERSIRNNTKALEEMQAKRKEARRQAEEEAKLLARTAAAKGETYNPANDFPPERGFVFSAEEIATLIAREDRLVQAREDSRARLAPPPQAPKTLRAA